jgi:hypothetical protein
VIELQCGCQPFGCPVVGIEIFRVYRGQPACGLEHLLVPGFGGLLVALTPQFRRVCVIEFDKRAVVEDMVSMALK